ncbi:MAG: SocA family protein [Alphaproteobacteria bacterium]|nr:SocA family protein [Alphaproteobacteria bacterium]
MNKSDQYNIIKVFFEAERYHLNTYGRPITGDNYVAMRYGTVPVGIYDIIKQNDINKDFPFTKVDKNILSVSRPANLSMLSKSDLEALDFGIKEYDNLDFSEVETKNHNEECWKKARKNRESNSPPIPFEDMINDEELKEELKKISKLMVI